MPSASWASRHSVRTCPQSSVLPGPGTRRRIRASSKRYRSSTGLCGDRRLVAGLGCTPRFGELPCQRPEPDLLAIPDQVNTVSSGLIAVVAKHPQQALRQPRMIDGKPEVEKFVAKCRQRLAERIANVHAYVCHGSIERQQVFPAGKDDRA